MKFSKNCSTNPALAFAALAVSITALQATPTVDPLFAGAYSITSLGVPNVPTDFGGLLVNPADPNSLMLVGQANRDEAAIYDLPLTRDAGGHVTGFAGPGTFRASAYGLTGGADGSLVLGPGGVLFYSSYPDNHIGQIKPGSTAPDKLINLIPQTGVASSLGGLQFVPDGFPGAGRLKLANYSVGRWYDATVSPDGTGTYNVTVTPGEGLFLGGSFEGVFYVPIGSLVFPFPSVLIADYKYEEIAMFQVDANGDPIPESRRTFISGLRGAEGITQDPVTGDLLVSTFGFGHNLYRIGGFNTPLSGDDPGQVPEPATSALLVSALSLGFLGRRLLRRA
ncbi:MAG: hypothetical protein SGI92_00800 [Bryobacteraceae bacterium]|nr:hypothetical protein [Bryobacteraceae bacterium]